MTENGSDDLPFEPPEQANIRLRHENARLQRLLSVHSIPIPQLAPENPPPAKAAELAPSMDRAERARKRIAVFRSLFRGWEDVYARRWENDDGRHEICAGQAGFESGIGGFFARRNNRGLARLLPAMTPPVAYGRRFQGLPYHDTPEGPHPEKRYLDASAKPGAKHIYGILTVNSGGVPSEPSAAVFGPSPESGKE